MDQELTETRIMDGKGKSQLQLQEYLKCVFLHMPGYICLVNLKGQKRS